MNSTHEDDQSSSGEMMALPPAEKAPVTSSDPDDLAQYQVYPTWRKLAILFVASWMTLVITLSSTAMLSATSEIAEEFSTTTEKLNISNAGVLLAMGSSSFIWGPISSVSPMNFKSNSHSSNPSHQIIGRKLAYNIAIFILCMCSIGAAAAPTMAVFVAMRVLAGLTGTFFMLAGQTMIADIFHPVSLISTKGAFKARI
jgi:MFS family permease